MNSALTELKNEFLQEAQEKLENALAVKAVLEKNGLSTKHADRIIRINKAAVKRYSE